MTRTTIAVTTTLTLSLLGAAALLFAGPLNPPVGPVAPTYKTLNEVEPRIAINAVNTPGDASARFILSQPGSYYLSGNVAGLAGVDVIYVTASGVTIDLNGFEISGGVQGIETFGAIQGLKIRNGSMRGSGNAVATGGGASGTVIEHLQINGCSADGIALTGDGNIVRDVAVRACGGFAIYSAGQSLLTHCAVVGNVGGISVGDHSIITGCSAVNNGVGFIVPRHGLLKDCVASGNTDDGFVGASVARLESCTAFGNLRGMRFDSGGFVIERCSILSNVEVGIAVVGGGGGRIDSCNIQGSGSGTAIGISIGSSATDVTITQNTFTTLTAGVRLDGQFCRVTNNAFNFTVPVTTTGGGMPIGNNLIGPMATPTSVATTTNPFANTQQ